MGGGGIGISLAQYPHELEVAGSVCDCWICACGWDRDVGIVLSGISATLVIPSWSYVIRISTLSRVYRQLLQFWNRYLTDLGINRSWNE